MYTTAQSVAITDSTTGASIYYTTDGSTPTASSTAYTGAISLSTSGATTISAIAVAMGYRNSAVASATYTLTIAAQPTPTPAFSPASGSFSSSQTVTISDTLAGATIYYTTDGSAPTTSSTQYTSPLTVSTTTTVNAIAVAANHAASTVATASYTINIPAAPSYTYKNVPIVGGGFVDGLYFHPKQQGLMYARTDVGGAYRWNNVAGGDTQWVPLLDFAGRYQSGAQLGVESLAMDPNDPTRLYVATGEYVTSGDKDYIFTSSNMGQSFTAVQLPFANGSNANGRFAGERLSVDPANGKHIYFGTRKNGLYESIDGGSTWNQVGAFPVQGSTGTSFDPGVGIIFEQFLSPSGAASNGNTKTIYYGVSDPTTNPATNQPTGVTGLYVSNDGGQTFLAVSGQPTGFYLNSGVFDPSNRYLYLSYARQAATVTAYQQTTPCTSNCISVGPTNVNDGQIWRYTLPTSVNPNGAWTNITPPLLSGETNAQYVSTAYGFSGVAIDPSNPNTVMVSTLDRYYPPPFDDIFRSLDGGQTWVDFRTNATLDDSIAPWHSFGTSATTTINWINHPAIDPFNPAHIMFAEGYGIWQTTDGTGLDKGTPGSATTGVGLGGPTNWTFSSQGVEETVILALASPPSGPAHLFSGMYDLGGFTHQSLTQSQVQQENPQFTDGTSVDFAWQSPLNVARVGYNASYNSTPLFQMEAFSSDGGVTWTPNTQAGLPTLPGGAAITQGQGTIAVAADGSNLVWMPVDAGVMAAYSTDHGQTWHASTGGPVQQSGVSLNVASGVIVLADRVNPKKFYLFNTSTATVYLSTNGGMTFAQQSQMSSVSANRLFASPAAEGDLWMTTYNGLYHSINSGSSFNTVLGGSDQSFWLGFGAPAAGQAYPALYMTGYVSGGNCAAPNTVSFTQPTECIYRSINGGNTFILVNDYAHQYSNPNIIVRDPQVFGRYYLGTPGRGIIEADSLN